ncbi:MAG TPA: TolC family protein [Longimicrobium sp.]|jgi:outer membrane protein TolC|uniref:TolC family protein n=1 Tax=Longimicrobium sp. TaxID=2029185 RepID=UPI002ED8424B
MSAHPWPGRLARGAALAAALLAAVPLAAQQPASTASQPPAGQRALTLDEALRLAEDASESVQIARAGVTRARGDVLRARSERLPQLNGSLDYTRALASEFQSLGGGSDSDTTTTPAPACGRFTPNPALPVAERLDSLEAAVNCAQNANPFAAFGDLPFGRENTWRFGLSFSQSVFNGGRTAAQNRIADAGRTRAEIELNSQRAQLALDVTQAYYDAALSDRLVTIAQATLQQAETTLEQTRLARQVGNQPEFELLRAQVQRDNQLPLVIQRRADRDLAYSRLALLLDLPAGASLALTSPLDDSRAVPVARFAANEALLGDTTVENRAPVQQALTAVSTQESALRIARSQRLPTLAITSQYGRVAYPTGAFPSLGDFRSNWTVGAGLTIPLFTGGRIRGDELVAQANLLEARARLRQAQDAARLDTRSALERLQAARAQYQASAGTVEQAARAYQIAEVRYREGISTQVELADSRILLQQAQANRAVAARDLQIAQARAALLPYLPIGAGQAGQSSGASQQQQPQQSAPRQQQAPASAQANAFTAGGE